MQIKLSIEKASEVYTGREKQSLPLSTNQKVNVRNYLHCQFCKACSALGKLSFTQSMHCNCST